MLASPKCLSSHHYHLIFSLCPSNPLWYLHVYSLKMDNLAFRNLLIIVEVKITKLCATIVREERVQQGNQIECIHTVVNHHCWMKNERFKFHIHFFKFDLREKYDPSDLHLTVTSSRLRECVKFPMAGRFRARVTSKFVKAYSNSCYHTPTPSESRSKFRSTISASSEQSMHKPFTPQTKVNSKVAKHFLHTPFG